MSATTTANNVRFAEFGPTELQSTSGHAGGFAVEDFGDGSMQQRRCLAITHLTADFNPAEVNTAVAAAVGAGMTLAPRTREQVERFFGDWELLDPGVCPVSAWRPDEPVDDPKGAYYWAGVARKP